MHRIRVHELLVHVVVLHAARSPELRARAQPGMHYIQCIHTMREKKNFRVGPKNTVGRGTRNKALILDGLTRGIFPLPPFVDGPSLLRHRHPHTSPQLQIMYSVSKLTWSKPRDRTPDCLLQNKTDSQKIKDTIIYSAHALVSSRRSSNTTTLDYQEQAIKIVDNSISCASLHKHM